MAFKRKSGEIKKSQTYQEWGDLYQKVSQHSFRGLLDISKRLNLWNAVESVMCRYGREHKRIYFIERGLRPCVSMGMLLPLERGFGNWVKHLLT